MFQPGISGNPRTIPTNVGTTHNPSASGTDTRGLGTMLVRARQSALPVHAVRRAPPPVSSHQLLRALRAFVVKQIVFYCHCWFVRHCGWG